MYFQCGGKLNIESIDNTCIPKIDENGEVNTCEGVDSVTHSMVESECIQGVLISEFVK
jgi:hypothetical protein